MCDLESNSSIRNPGPIDWIHYLVPRATLNALTDDARMPRVKRLHCTYGTADPTLYHLTQLILPCLKTPEMFSQLFMDYFTLMISSHLVGKYGQSREAFPQHEGGLAPWQKRRVVELVHEHLDGEIKLATLAEECGLSVSHFARSFRKSFGTSAHQYLILHRIEIAKTLLSKTQSSLVRNCDAHGIFRSSRSHENFCERCWRASGKMEARNCKPQEVLIPWFLPRAGDVLTPSNRDFSHVLTVISSRNSQI